jgi:hypothetical protein
MDCDAPRGCAYTGSLLGDVVFIALPLRAES